MYVCDHACIKIDERYNNISLSCSMVHPHTVLQQDMGQGHKTMKKSFINIFLF